MEAGLAYRQEKNDVIRKAQKLEWWRFLEIFLRCERRQRTSMSSDIIFEPKV